MTDSLVEFIRARLDEDEQTAKSATAGPWTTSDWDPENDEQTVVLPWRSQQEKWGATSPEAVAAFSRVDSWPDETNKQGLRRTDASHIALHDPARVLRGVEAKRAILDLHPPRMVTHVDHNSPPHSVAVCRECVGREIRELGDHVDGTSYVGYPCRTLRALALEWADHELYREGWKP